MRVEIEMERSNAEEERDHEDDFTFRFSSPLMVSQTLALLRCSLSLSQLSHTTREKVIIPQGSQRSAR